MSNYTNQWTDTFPLPLTNRCRSDNKPQRDVRGPGQQTGGHGAHRLGAARAAAGGAAQVGEWEGGEGGLVVARLGVWLAWFGLSPPSTYHMPTHTLTNSFLNKQIEAGGDVDVKARYISPTIVSGVTPESRLMQEEIFGVYLCIYIRLVYAQPTIGSALLPSMHVPFSVSQHTCLMHPTPTDNTNTDNNTIRPHPPRAGRVLGRGGRRHYPPEAQPLGPLRLRARRVRLCVCRGK